jgi:hypothetical protein
LWGVERRALLRNSLNPLVSNSPPWGVYIGGWGGRLAPHPRHLADSQGRERENLGRPRAWLAQPTTPLAHPQALGASTPLSNKGRLGLSGLPSGRSPLRWDALIN